MIKKNLLLFPVFLLNIGFHLKAQGVTDTLELRKQEKILNVGFHLMAPGLPDTLAIQKQKQIEFQEEEKKGAFEFGLGASLFNHYRVNLTNFVSDESSDKYQIYQRRLMPAGNIYIARELNPYFYLDLQGSLGVAKENFDNDETKNSLFYMAGLGLQFRISPFFKSRYVEPYIRVGFNYFHKEYKARYIGSIENDKKEHLFWESSDQFNKKRDDRNNFFPFSLGAGVNVWLNNSIGMGLQADYVAAFYNNTPHIPMLTVRVLYRIGGESKTPKPQYVVMPPVLFEKSVEIEKIVEKQLFLSPSLQLCDMFDNITFEFDKADITVESAGILDLAASILKQYKDDKFLITGFTDARGSEQYNIGLSRRRAAAVVRALEERGVPSDMIKSRGVGKKIAAMPVSETHIIREGDRKVTIERIIKMGYWNKLSKRDY